MTVAELEVVIGDPERERTSWWPRPLRRRDGMPDAIPTVLTRTDGLALLYPGRLNAAVGESESCKTWAALLATREVVARGGHVLLVDFEDSENTALDRLEALGVEALELIHFVHPEEPLLDRNGRWTCAQGDLAEITATWSIELAVFDGVTEGMGLEGLNPLDNADVARWYRSVPRLLTRKGAAGLVLDHVTKSKEDRGRYALGGVHKLNGIDGAAYGFAPVDPFAPGHTGTVRITVAKDRPGIVRAEAVERKHVGLLTLTSSPAGQVTGRIEPPTGATGDFEPTHLMEKVSRRCELYPGTSKTDLRALGNSDYVDVAIEKLAALGHIDIRREGRAHAHYLGPNGPYRETPDA